jgi:hypothetical protein
MSDDPVNMENEKSFARGLKAAWIAERNFQKFWSGVFFASRRVCDSRNPLKLCRVGDAKYAKIIIG